jgi:HSP20 family molecular chaperone IbpA
MLPLTLHQVFVNDVLKRSYNDSILSSLRKRNLSSSVANVGIEVASTNEDYRVELDLPGIKPDDIDITVEDDCGRITVTGIRRLTHNQGQHTVKKSKVSRTFAVNAAAVDLSQLRANLSDGVLVVSAPKLLKSPPRKIAVTTIVPHREEEEDTNNKSIEKESSTANEESSSSNISSSGTKNTTAGPQAPTNKEEAN